MKLILENWRKFLTEDLEGPTMDMGGKTWDKMQDEKYNRIKETASELGYHLDKKLGSGQMGDVFLVENKKTGERIALKVVTRALYGGPRLSKREFENYQFAMNNKDSIKERWAMYLPDVYEIHEGVKDYFIFMELLENMPDRVKADLFRLNIDDIGLSREKKYATIMKDPEAVYELVSGALYGSLILRQGDPAVQEQILQNVPNQVIKKIMQLDVEEIADPMRLSEIIVEESMQYLKQDPGYYDSLPWALKNTLHEMIEEYLEKQIVPIHSGDGSASQYGGHTDKVTRNFPESQNLIRAMKHFMRNHRWEPKDIHSGNVMVRPGTKDFVITDLGLFMFK
jgi:serine/threonine protein kinase